MGGQLSFIVLCLINAFVCEEAQRRAGLQPAYIINGDDHVMACNKEAYYHYKVLCNSVGFVINKRKTIISRRYISLNSTLIKVAGKKKLTIRYLNLAFLQETLPFDATSVTAKFQELMESTCTDNNIVKGMFIRAKREDLKKISLNGLLNHQLPPAMGGLGIITPSESRELKAALRRNSVTVTKF